MELTVVTVDRDRALPPPITVVVAVRRMGNRRSRGAVWWWVTDYLIHYADRFVLINVMPSIAPIPTPLLRAINWNFVDFYHALSRGNLPNPSAIPLSIGEYSSRHERFNQREFSSIRIYEINGGSFSSSFDCEANGTSSSVSDPGYLRSIEIAEQRQERNHQNLGKGILEDETVNEGSSVSSAETKQAEVEQLGLEQGEDLVHGQNKVPFLPSRQLHLQREQVYKKTPAEEKGKCLETINKIEMGIDLFPKEAYERHIAEMKAHQESMEQKKQVYKKTPAEEKGKCLETINKIEMGIDLFPKEAYERHIAEMKAHQESMEQKKTIDALLPNDHRMCKRYRRDEIEIATEFFSETKMIGEGSYGKVYRCELDETPVAVKLLPSDASETKEEFLTKIEVLYQLRHPHIVSLLGACPEIGCLVFEYMENGSLEDFVSSQSSRHTLPWFVRFRIAFEVASGLALLHNKKPDPIIHGDLKPGNIFLDKNYVSKIGDVGMSRLVSNVALNEITDDGDSVICGSLYYMDPAYQQTRTIQPESDLYAFGVILLQLLSAQHPYGLVFKFEDALSTGLLSDILDKSIPHWPLAEAKELAQMALKCSRVHCKYTPDLETEVLPLLKKLAYMADATPRVQSQSINAPKEFFCPILQEVMEDPHIAADGFTYEYRAIKAWLERHRISPVTKRRLQHKVLIQNHTLRYAIEDWRSRITSTSG